MTISHTHGSEPAPERPSAPLRRRLADQGRRIARRFTLAQVSALMALSGIVAVTLVTGFLMLREQRLLFQEGLDHAEQSAAYLADHAQRLFEVSDLVLHGAEASFAGLTWDQIASSDEAQAGFRRTDALLPYVDVLFAADAAGDLRITSLGRSSTRQSIADRSIFQQAKRATDYRLLIGDPVIGRLTHRPTFVVGRRRSAPDGGFDGLIGAAMSLAYFTDYWKTLDKRNDEQIALVRGGTGDILVRYPDTPGSTDAGPLGPSLLTAAADGAATAAFAPGPHTYGVYHRVGTLPIYVAVVFRDAVILARWHDALWHIVPPAIGAIVALVLLMLLAHRLAVREEAARLQIERARLQLSTANADLEHRVAERTAELVESNREVQRFAYIVSHDLRAPLVNIMGFTSELQSLREALIAGPAEATERAAAVEDFDEAIGFIKSSVDKMDRLIKAILALSRQGQRAFKAEPLDMDALMRSVADGVAHRVQQSGAAITIGPLPAISADRVAVEQVFANLVDNAVKYLRPGVPGLIAIGATASTTTARFTVADNGRGIHVNDRERVFELFRRAGKQDQPGEGIGLANVRSLVRRLQGTITLDSTEGMGCVFTVTMPRQDNPGGDPRA